MPVPATITDLDPVASNNFPQGADIVGASIYATHQAHSAILKKQFIRGADIAVTASGTLTLPVENRYFVLTGTGHNVTGISDAYNGRVVTLKLPAGLTFVNSPSLILSGGYDRTTFDGDTITLVNETSGIWREIGYNYNLGKPSFSVHRGGVASSNFADGNIVKVSFNLWDFDNYNAFDPLTNFSYTIPTSGTYVFNFSIKPVTQAAGMVTEALIYKNGAAIRVGASRSDVAAFIPTSTVSCVLELNKGDVIDFRVQWLGVTGSFAYNGNTLNTYAYGHKL